MDCRWIASEEMSGRLSASPHFRIGQYYNLPIHRTETPHPCSDDSAASGTVVDSVSLHIAHRFSKSSPQTCILLQKSFDVLGVGSKVTQKQDVG